MRGFCDKSTCSICNAEPTPVRDPFPSLSLMSKPVTPAPPRLVLMSVPGRSSEWRCMVELKDICRRRSKTMANLNLDDYAAHQAIGWGRTKELAYGRWKAKWKELHP